MQEHAKTAGHDFLKSLGRTRLRPGGGVMTNWLLDQVKIDKDMRILEVACNRADNLIRIYTEHKCLITGIDIDDSALAEARENLKLLDLDKQIEVLHMNALDLTFEDESFDLVINEAMLTMLTNEDKLKALANYHRVLKKGGCFLNHEVALDTESEEKRQAVSRFANMNVYPLSVLNWNRLLLDSGFEPFSQKTGKMMLMDRDTIIRDEGPIGACNFYKKAHLPENKERFEMMVAKSKESPMNYIVIASRKKEK